LLFVSDPDQRIRIYAAFEISLLPIEFPAAPFAERFETKMENGYFVFMREDRIGIRFEYFRGGA
jgi:hypothetical protein